MGKVPKGRYSKEFRVETGKMVVEGEMLAGEVAKRDSVPKSTVELGAGIQEGDVGRDRQVFSANVGT